MSTNKLPLKWFLLGRDPLLSAGEIVSCLRRMRIPYEKPTLQSSFFFVSADLPPEIINRLGGTIKIAEEIGVNLSEDDLLAAIRVKLSAETKKIIFGISFYGDDHTQDVERWGKELKKNLKAEGRQVRYVFNRESTLSSVTVEKNSLIDKGFEFIVRQPAKKSEGGYSLARTVAVQPFESFSARDYGRPSRDSESGMLPPKLAMMLINLSETPLDAALLDPFCGSGTIVSEALLLGYTQIFGTDISERAIADSRQNIAWLMKKEGRSDFPSATAEGVGGGLSCLPVEKLSAKFAEGSISGIATEPYMGKPKTGQETPEELAREAGELAKLYLEALTQFKKILRPGGPASPAGGRVVFVIPRFTRRSGLPVIISDKIVPQLEKMGFTIDPILPEFSRSPFALYQRPGQFVAREIWRFRL